MQKPCFIDTIELAVDRVLAELPGEIVLGTPLGIGKPNPFLNALYRRIKADPARRLKILTALSLEKPVGSSELERRFLEPIVERVFGDYPDLEYVKDLRAGKLPPNITVMEFFLKSGDYLDNAAAQQAYISTNYSFVARDLALHGVNLIAQAVAAKKDAATWRFSLSSNPDVTPELMERLQSLPGHRFLCVGVVNRELPFMPNAAEVPPDFFDLLVTDPAGTHALFAPPNTEVSAQDYAIGLHAASLVPDGGTLQIGIGALGDAIAQALIVRDRYNDEYRQLLGALGSDCKGRELGRFETGLYGCSEMLGNGLLKLLEAGIMRREVRGGIVLHGAFFLGPRDFYEALRTLPPEMLAKIGMDRIDFINQLDGHYALGAAQRQKARFMNTVMMVTLLGAAVSDGLESGQVVSGVGGQYNFVAMGHALPDARSILLLRATHESQGSITSNIVWTYGHVTIPRHLRDIVITEYGVADLRGQPDAEIIKRLLAVADSRFQDELLEAAKRHGKLEHEYELPGSQRQNLPARIHTALQPFHARLPDYPFGTDYTDDELGILAALQRLKHAAEHPRELALLALRSVFKDKEVPQRYLERLGLDEVSTLRQRFLRRLFVGSAEAGPLQLPP